MSRLPHRSVRRRADRGDPDRVLVRRAGRRAAAQAALLVALSFLLCAGLVLLIVITGQQHAADNALRAATARADDVIDPPQGITLLLQHVDGQVRTSPGGRGVLPYQPGLLSMSGRGGPAIRLNDVHTAVGEFRVRTERRRTSAGTVVVQAALSLAPQHAERARLLAALGAAAGVALLSAAALGAVTGRRTVRGLVDTMSRQRRFVADASHELRTPLAVLSTRAQLLRRHANAADLEPATRKVLTGDADRLIADSGRLADIVDDLLAASEPSPPQAPPADLPRIAQDVVAELRPLAEDQSVDVQLHCPPVAADPEDEPALLVLGGATAVRRSLVALLDNAIRHSPAGGSVTVTITPTATAATVTVSDSGPGIPAEVRGRLFDRFSSGDRPGRPAADPASPRRYGLGLALVADTVHRVGGTITVSTASDGTTFTLTLPRPR